MSSTINAKAVEAINKVGQGNQEISVDEAEALISAVDACTKGDQQLLPHVVLRALHAIPAAIATNESLAGKALLSLVNTLAAPTSNEALRQGAIEGLAGVALKSTSKQIDVTREVADVLLQVSLPTSGFSDDVRKKARDLVNKQLIEACPKGVVGKMLHWLSDDREDDEAAQIDAERKVALAVLNNPVLSRAPALAQIQQDEQIPKIAARVLSVVSAHQFYRLLPVISNFVAASESSAAAVVDAVCGAKCDSDKNWESLYSISRYLPKGLKTDAPFDKLSATVSKKTSLEGDADSVARMLKAFVAACQLVTSESAPKKVGVAKELAARVLGSAELSANLTFVEAALLSLAALARDEESVKAAIDDSLAASLNALVSGQIAPQFDKYVYAVKKEGRQNARPHDHIAIACLENIKLIGGKLAEKQSIPQAGISPSWLSTRKSLPVVASGAKGVFQRAVENAATTTTTTVTGMIRQRE
jgi:hypothetical protein